MHKKHILSQYGQIYRVTDMVQRAMGTTILDEDISNRDPDEFLAGYNSTTETRVIERTDPDEIKADTTNHIFENCPNDPDDFFAQTVQTFTIEDGDPDEFYT